MMDRAPHTFLVVRTGLPSLSHSQAAPGSASSLGPLAPAPRAQASTSTHSLSACFIPYGVCYVYLCVRARVGSCDTVTGRTAPTQNRVKEKLLACMQLLKSPDESSPIFFHRHAVMARVQMVIKSVFQRKGNRKLIIACLLL